MKTYKIAFTREIMDSAGEWHELKGHATGRVYQGKKATRMTPEEPREVYDIEATLDDVDVTGTLTASELEAIKEEIMEEWKQCQN
jgi:hypothetical protein